jgi:hypothetical protein
MNRQRTKKCKQLVILLEQECLFYLVVVVQKKNDNIARKHHNKLLTTAATIAAGQLVAGNNTKQELNDVQVSKSKEVFNLENISNNLFDNNIQISKTKDKENKLNNLSDNNIQISKTKDKENKSTNKPTSIDETADKNNYEFIDKKGNIETLKVDKLVVGEINVGAINVGKVNKEKETRRKNIRKKPTKKTGFLNMISSKFKSLIGDDSDEEIMSDVSSSQLNNSDDESDTSSNKSDESGEETDIVDNASSNVSNASSNVSNSSSNVSNASSNLQNSNQSTIPGVNNTSRLNQSQIDNAERMEELKEIQMDQRLNELKNQQKLSNIEFKNRQKQLKQERKLSQQRSNLEADKIYEQSQAQTNSDAYTTGNSSPIINIGGPSQNINDSFNTGRKVRYDDNDDIRDRRSRRNNNISRDNDEDEDEDDNDVLEEKDEYTISDLEQRYRLLRNILIKSLNVTKKDLINKNIKNPMKSINVVKLLGSQNIQIPKKMILYIINLTVLKHHIDEVLNTDLDVILTTKEPIFNLINNPVQFDDDSLTQISNELTNLFNDDITDENNIIEELVKRTDTIITSIRNIVNINKQLGIYKNDEGTTVDKIKLEVKNIINNIQKTYGLKISKPREVPITNKTYTMNKKEINVDLIGARDAIRYAKINYALKVKLLKEIRKIDNIIYHLTDRTNLTPLRIKIITALKDALNNMKTSDRNNVVRDLYENIRTVDFGKEILTKTQQNTKSGKLSNATTPPPPPLSHDNTMLRPPQIPNQKRNYNINGEIDSLLGNINTSITTTKPSPTNDTDVNKDVANLLDNIDTSITSTTKSSLQNKTSIIPVADFTYSDDMVSLLDSINDHIENNTEYITSSNKDKVTNSEIINNNINEDDNVTAEESYTVSDEQITKIGNVLNGINNMKKKQRQT